MKNTLLTYLSGSMVLCALIFYSCVNHISDEDPLSDAEVPIQLSTHASGTTELPQQGFRENDVIGLYGLIYPNTLSDARYLDNIRLTCDASLNFIPEKEIFFPKGEDKCELVAYFPYQKEGLEAGKSQLEVSVRSDQDTGDNFVLSDFRIARTDYQTFSDSQVKLTFRHIGCLLKIKIVNASENANALIPENDIETHLYGFYRQALYDLDEKEFSDWELPEVISPFGEWIQKEDQLTGKQAILIPQVFRKDDQYLTLSIDGKVHICPFPESLKLESGKICELTIRYKPEEREIGDVTCETEDWTEGTNGESETQQLTHPIYLSDLPFDKSGVCQILYQGRQVAEVCKEFIRCGQTEAQGIVVYPVTDGKSDLTQGTVLHLLDVSQPVHGGTLSWDLSTGQCTYVPGQRLPVPYFFIDYDGSILFSSPKNAQPVVIEPLLLADDRPNESTQYPLTKIGTRYWMRENLKATRYNEGTQIPKKTDFTTASAGYGVGPGDNYFYSEDAVKTGKLCPAGWRIPATSQWEELLDYLDWDASWLKNGSWEEELYPATNLTGFNGIPVGMFLRTYQYLNQVAVYWSTGESETEIPEYSYFLMHSERNVQEGINRFEKGLSVRCIRNTTF